MHKFTLVAQVAHQEETATAALFQTFASGRVGHTFGVEAGAFIGNTNRKRVFLAAQGDGNTFVAVGLVAMQDGVGDGFGKTDENIPVNIGGKIVASGYVVDKRFNFRNVIGVGR